MSSSFQLTILSYLCTYNYLCILWYNFRIAIIIVIFSIFSAILRSSVQEYFEGYPPGDKVCIFTNYGVCTWGHQRLISLLTFKIFHYYMIIYFTMISPWTSELKGLHSYRTQGLKRLWSPSTAKAIVSPAQDL